MCWAVCSGAPHWQAADGRSPHRCMAALNRPTPVRIRFNDTHSLLGRFAPGGTVVLGVISSWAGRGVSCQLALHVWQMLKSDPLSFAAWWEKGRRDFSRCWPRDTEPSTMSWSRLFGLLEALVTSLWVWSSLRRGAGAMPESTGRNAVGVGRRHPVISLMVSFRAVSSFLAWELLHHAGEAYSAALYTRARALVRRVVAQAPHFEPARRRRRLFLEDTFVV